MQAHQGTSEKQDIAMAATASVIQLFKPAAQRCRNIKNKMNTRKGQDNINQFDRQNALK